MLYEFLCSAVEEDSYAMVVVFLPVSLAASDRAVENLAALRFFPLFLLHTSCLVTM